MKLKFEKKLELEMEITKHRVDNDDNHRFTLAFNKNIRNCINKEPITEVEFIAALVTDKSWFQNEYPRLPNIDDVYGIDPFDDDDGDYILFSTLFKDYNNFASIVQEMCIEYCKQNKIPPIFMDTASSEYSDEYCALAHSILDGLTKKNIKYLSHTNDFIHNDIYKYANKEIKYQLLPNNITIESDIITINHNKKDSETLSEMISNISLQFSKEWNQNIIGKYEWDL